MQMGDLSDNTGMRLFSKKSPEVLNDFRAFSNYYLVGMGRLKPPND
jgi:hypothetical protein